MGATRIRQLVLVKYLFQQGRESFDAQDDMACGIAVSHFQDAVELFLYTAIKEKELDVKKDRLAFLELWRTVNDYRQSCKPTPKKLPFRAQMEELNKVRVQFKHNGIPPARSVAEACLLDTRRFLVECTRDVFGEDFESISLVDRIANEEIRAVLKQAEDHLEKGEFSSCFSKCEKAHGLASTFALQAVARVSQFMQIVVEDPNRARSTTVVDLGSYLNVLREISLAAILNISANDFFRYAALSRNRPLVLWGMFGESIGPGSNHPQTIEYQEDDARFAVRYVTDYVLAVESRMKRAS